MFPCPLHSSLDSESQAEVIRRSKLAQSWGLEVKWVDHEVLESMIIINPPTRDNGDLDDGIAFIDLSLPHLDLRKNRADVLRRESTACRHRLGSGCTSVMDNSFKRLKIRYRRSVCQLRKERHRFAFSNSQ